MPDWSWLCESPHRIGVYWLLSAAGFARFGGIALRRFWHGMSSGRLAIVVFSVSWALLCGDNMLIRFGVFDRMHAEAWPAEVIRVACVVSLWWMSWEFSRNRITIRHPVSESRT